MQKIQKGWYANGFVAYQPFDTVVGFGELT